MRRDDVARLQELAYSREGTASVEQLELLDRYQNQAGSRTESPNQDLDEPSIPEEALPSPPVAEGLPPKTGPRTRTRGILVAWGFVAAGIAVGAGATLALTVRGPEVLHLPPGAPYETGSVVYYGTVEGADVWTGIRTEEGDRCLIVGNTTGNGTIQCGPLYSTRELSTVTDTGVRITVKFRSDGGPGTLTHTVQ